jgi:anti-sigma factor RsiW
MQCYDWEMLSRYQDGSLGDGENQHIAEHLMECPSCQEKMRSLGQVGLFFRIALGSRRHAECLSDEELGAYLSGRSSPEDRTRVEAHLLICPKCLHEVAVLSDPEMLATSARSPVPDVRAQERFRHLAPRPRVREPVLNTVTGWGVRVAAAGFCTVCP